MKYFLTSIVVLVSATIAHADDGVDGKRISDTVRKMRDQVFQNCIAKLKVVASNTVNGNVELKINGTYVLATCSELSLSDKSISMMIDKPGRRKQEATHSQQLYLPRGKKSITIRYDAVNKSIQGVSYWPHDDYALNYHGLTRDVRLDCILSRFGPFSQNIVDVVGSRVPTTKRNANGQLTGQYVTEYGLLAVTIERSGQLDRLKEVEMTQTAKDVYNSLSAGATLAEVRDSVLGKTPDGLSSVTSRFRFSYDNTSGRPFSELSLFDSYTATGQTFRSNYVLRLTDYKKCFDAVEIEALRVPIPEGERVGLVGDPYNGTLALTYRNGDIVRQVDGASLEEVVTEERFHKKFLYVVVSVVGTMCIAFGFRYAWKRWATKSKGQSP